MITAAIVRGTFSAVKLENLTEPEFDSRGTLYSFTYSEKKYKFFKRSAFRLDLYDESAVEIGYYEVEKYAEHMAYPSVEGSTLSDLKKLHKFEYEWFEDADDTDQLEMKFANFEAPYTFYKYDKYSFTHSEDNQYIKKGKWDKSLMGEPELVLISQGLYATSFFNRHIGNIENYTSEEDKIRYYKLIVYSSLRIGMIDQIIFPILLNVDVPDLDITEISDMVEAIRLDWENDTDPSNFDIESAFGNYVNLKTFYSGCYKNQLSISKYNIYNRTLLLLRILPISTLHLIPIETRINALKSMVTVDSDIPDYEEEFALKIVNSVNIDNQEEVNTFLGALIEEKYPTGNSLPPYLENLFSLLYHNIQNYKGIVKGFFELFGDTSFSRDNQTRLIFALYVIWIESKYNFYKNLDPDGNPDWTLVENSTYEYDKTYRRFAVIRYHSEKNWMGVFEDQFTFEFDMHANGIYYITDEDVQWVSHESMHMYQPITLASYPSEMDTAIEVPVFGEQEIAGVPLFFLKYLDDFGDRQDLNTQISFFIDVVTTITGIGSLAKLRHLRHLSKLGQVLVIVESVNITAGVLNLILSHVEACDESDFCKKVRTVLTFIEISSLVTDPIIIYKTKKAAQEAVDIATETGWPPDFLDSTFDSTPKQKIEELADMDLASFLAKVSDEVKSEFANRIKKANLKVDGTPHSPPLFEITHTDIEIDNIVNHGLSVGLSKTEIEGLLFISCRVKKPKTASEIMEQMNYWMIVKSRKYPYKFDTIEQYEAFKSKIIANLESWGIPSGNVRVSGSSVRYPEPQDVDVDVIIDNVELTNLKESLIERYKNYYSDKNGFMNRQQLKSYKEAIKELEKAIEKGIIKPGLLKTIESGGNSFMKDLWEVQGIGDVYNLDKLNVSIIIKNGEFDFPPYLTF